LLATSQFKALPFLSRVIFDYNHSKFSLILVYSLPIRFGYFPSEKQSTVYSFI
jgi:hypothetical protein